MTLLEVRRSVDRHAVIVAGLVVLFAAGYVVAQEPGEAGEAMAQMMAAWQEYAEVGPQHEALQRRVGSWDATVKFWYAPGGQADVSQAHSTVEAIMGGRYMLERFTSTMPDGSAFEGLGMVGFDNLQRRFVATWVDSMSSGVMTAESTSFANDFSRIEYHGEAPDPVAKNLKDQRSVEYWKTDDVRVMEAWEKGPDGADYKVMEITYTRR
jgi:hypothetical protein